MLPQLSTHGKRRKFPVILIQHPKNEIFHPVEHLSLSITLRPSLHLDFPRDVGLKGDTSYQ